MTSPPVPHGSTAQRPDWTALPPAVQDAIEERTGAVASAASQGGGFTNGFASRLTLAEGGKVFVKAVSMSASPDIHRSYAREAVVAATLPSDVPAPRFRWSATVEDWLILAFDDVEGRTPSRPWVPEELTQVLDALPLLAASLTPAPRDDLDTTADLDAEFSYWRRTTPGSTLALLEADWAELSAGQTASHFDLRDDNLLLTDDGRVLACDWNWLCLTAPWVDLVGLLVSAYGDGYDAQALLAQHPLSRDVPPRAIDSFLAALGGYFTEAAARPPFAHSPWMRSHQALSRDATMGWLRLRTC